MPNTIYPEADQESCADCGSELYPGQDRSFAVSAEWYLCFECAVKRGGVYEEEEDRWIVLPQVPDLPDERRPHL